MINLAPSISQIEVLLAQNTEASLTYAALESRLAIERICYERLRIAHDYISHDDVKRWQPRDIVNILIREVDSNTAKTFTLSISKEPAPEGLPSPAFENYEAIEFLSVGTQIGFDPDKLGKLWNALAKLALHISIPVNKDHDVSRYGDAQKIRTKVVETLEEIKRINEGTLMSSGIGEGISFECICGAKNKRRLGLLKEGQTISCINPDCNENFAFSENDLSFGRRTLEIICRNCGKQREIPKKVVEKLRTDQHVQFDCEVCDEKIYISWRPMQSQRSKPIEPT